MAMQTYIVKRDFPLGGKVRRKGHHLQLSDRQARHLLIAGFLEKPQAERTPTLAAEGDKPANKKGAKG